PWEGVITGFVLFAVGGPFLWWFWFRNLVRQATSWRDGYATAIALGAWFVGVTALAALTYAVLATLLGLDRLDRFSSPLPIQITTFVAAGLVYWHHRGVLGRVRTPLIRLMHYAFSAFGFVVGAGGLVTLVATLIENLTDRSIAGSGSRAVLGSAVAVALAALVIWRYWLPAQSLAGDPTEQRALPRRLAIVGLLTGSALVVAGALIAVLFVLLRSVLGSDADVSDVLSWAVPLTLVAGGMAGYFAGIRPRRAAVESAGSALPVKVSTVTVVAADPGPLPKMVEGMRFLRRSDGVGAVDEERAQAIIAALAQLEARAALVQVNADSFDVIPLA
ncbi:MAG: DUF5671 domain-containing protein, partial [Acidimicrobiia bacterium]|nr:DUF5671 domain-containing protein [Acidimicrobiia bacterium]